MSEPLEKPNEKEIDENNKMENLEISSRKLDTKETFYSKMGTIKDRNSKDLKEAEEIKNRWQEFKNCTKKILMTQITMTVWSLNREPDILQCEGKWALGSITINKASGGDGIPAKLFQS